MVNDELAQLSTERLLIGYRKLRLGLGSEFGVGLKVAEAYLEEAQRRDALIAAQAQRIADLEAERAAPQPVGEWTPVDSYINQEILDFTAGGSLVVNVVISGRHIRLSDSNGAEVSTLLRPNHAVCKRVDAPQPVAMPVEAEEAIGNLLSLWYARHGSSDTYTMVRAWLGALQRRPGQGQGDTL